MADVRQKIREDIATVVWSIGLLRGSLAGDSFRAMLIQSGVSVEEIRILRAALVAVERKLVLATDTTRKDRK